EVTLDDAIQFREERFFLRNREDDPEEIGSFDLLPELDAIGDGPIVIVRARHPEPQRRISSVRCFATLSIPAGEIHSYRGSLANGMLHRQLDDALDHVAVRHL